ncbi:MAG: YdjY domain-containing protein [Thermoguttaceae bacterium]|nr:YdjY domain-containing protein [Thermoguttaceae bacterium]
MEYSKQVARTLGFGRGILGVVMGLGLLAGCQAEPKPPSKPEAKAPAPQRPTTEPKQEPGPSQPVPSQPSQPSAAAPKPTSVEEKPTSPPSEPLAPPAAKPESSTAQEKTALQKQQPEPESENPFDPKVIEQRRKMIEEEMARLEAEWREKQKKRIAELGPPLVENADKLIRLHPIFPVWADRDQKRIVMVGEVCKREGMLEMFACPRRTKEHESIVVVDTSAQIVHAGLLAVGAEPGRPVQYHPTYKAATGDEIEVTVVWKDKEGRQHTARAQDWVRHARTKKPMEHPWVFAGSVFAKSEETGQVSYMADGGDFICVSNFPTAMLDLPVPSSSVNAELEFEAFTERIPPEGTPVTIILAPKKKSGHQPPAEKPVSVPSTPPEPKSPNAEHHPKPAESQPEKPAESTPQSPPPQTQ